jgi:molecular chaperone GrpE
MTSDQNTNTEGEVIEFGPSAEAALNARIAELETQAATFKDQWMRATADYKNFKRRTDAERSELVRSASQGLVLKLLPVIDDLERAQANIPAEIADSSWWGGARLILQKFRTVLESEGVTTIESQGQPFDPNQHEAVTYEDAPGQDGLVIEQFQKGYKIGDRVLRPAMVKVGKG